MRSIKTAFVLVLAAAALTAAPARAAVAWFDFNRNTNLNSVLTLYYEGLPGHISSASWRAGSGSTTDECMVGRGWLPVGWYDLKGHWNNYDATIKGRVFWLQDKQCYNGTWRRELFIHSEETAANGQYCPTSGDDPYCWDGDFDYYSAGCIKVSRAGSPNDLAVVHSNWHNRSGDQRHGAFTIGHWLNVHN